jgi:phosphoribosyl-AMP cyclohydrolase
VSTKQNLEENLEFTPQFDENGLIPAIAQDARTGQVLMVAYMNAAALDATIESGYATYFSRSRQKLWKKGEESGHRQKVEQILVDCDQDCLILKVSVDAGQCHVGYQSCFYRALVRSGFGVLRSPTGVPRTAKNLERSTQHAAHRTNIKLEFIAKKVYDPKKTYKK